MPMYDNRIRLIGLLFIYHIHNNTLYKYTKIIQLLINQLVITDN